MHEIMLGDCLEVMHSFPENHFSAIVTDPPYGLHFMGKDWDKYSKGKVKCGRKVVGTHTNSEAHETARYDPSRDDEFQSFIFDVGSGLLRIAKPGGHVVMFGAPRRYHRQVCALEDAGWEIRDCLMWLFGSGFPKSHNHFGIDGFGTALKPAYEPIILAMKPLDGTFKQNAEKWGQAGINIDGCRIETSDILIERKGGFGNSNAQIYGNSPEGSHFKPSLKGRWPANVILDDEAAAMLDEQSGVSESKGFKHTEKTTGFHDCLGRKQIKIRTDNNGHFDRGGASRFFYCAKTSSRERNEGLDLDPQAGGIKNGSGRGFSETDPNKEIKYKNNHPTVKPLALMRYLITLVAPPENALILDPFAGSGSTILAAKQLGISAIGIEKQPEYAEIARARVAAYEPEVKESEQLEMFA